MEDIRGLLVTHKRAEVCEIEELCRDSMEEVRGKLRSHGADEAFVIQTCNRAEFYVSGEPGEDVLDGFAEEHGVREGVARRVEGSTAVRHLMRLASGLESMVIGEDEILGQLREAYHDACDVGDLDDTLDTAVLKAIHIGEKARDETSVNEGNASMGSAAVELARRHLGGLDDLQVVVVGAGEMGELVARALVERDASYEDILVANRTFDTAERLAREVGGSPVKFNELSRHLEEADVVVSATGAPHLVFDGGDIEGSDVLVMDLANPRDVDPEAGEEPGVDLVDIDDLSEVSEGSIQRRREAAEEVEELIDEEITQLEEQLKQERAMEMLAEIYSRAEEIRVKETQEALRKLETNGGLSQKEREIVDDLTQSIVNQLLSTPTDALKNAAVSEDYETLRSASEIFRLAEQEAEGSAEP